MTSASLSTAPESDLLKNQTDWPLLNCIVFRFGFIYLMLFCVPDLLRLLPLAGDFLTEMADLPWAALCPWVAVHIFHLSGAVTRYHETGSGDTTLQYIRMFCYAALALFGSLLWSLFDLKRKQYRTLYAWLRLVVRFYLAFVMLGYGFAKIFQAQFPPPTLFRLTETYGESSPMGLLWTLMGASRPYAIFGGLAEASGGLLLLFRRTTALGSLASAAVLLNVVLLNFSYDVPVKLYSLHLLLLALFLLLPDVMAIWRFFVTHQPARLGGVWLAPFQRAWLRRAAIILQILVVCSILFMTFSAGYAQSKAIEASFTPSVLSGVWDVDRFTGAAAGWQRVVVSNAGMLNAKTAAGENLRFRTKYTATATQTIQVTLQSSREKGLLHYERRDPDHLLLDGTIGANAVRVELHKVALPTGYLLTNRGFHWISEDPFNR